MYVALTQTYTPDGKYLSTIHVHVEQLVLIVELLPQCDEGDGRVAANVGISDIELHHREPDLHCPLQLQLGQHGTDGTVVVDIRDDDGELERRI